MDSPAADRGLAPAPQAVERFRQAVNDIWPDFERVETLTFGAAVSGGPDSTALLLLAAAAWPGRVAAATVDHGLRPESASEAAAVALLCERLGVPHRVLAVRVPPGNVQAEARRARYAALADWVCDNGVDALATAHHADDQAETLLLRLNRASGVAGLAGTREVSTLPDTGLPLIRPLLEWRRSDLVAVVEAAGVAAVEDPSNADDRYDRARLRRAMADADWLDIAAMAQSASHLADADAALDWAARREWQERVRKDPLGMTYHPAAPKAIALRVLTRLVTELDGYEPRGGAVARLFDSLVERRPASIGNLVARPTVEGWSFTAAPRRRDGNA